MALRVFISYTHENENIDRVWELSERLRADGVDCRIDQQEQAPAEGWPRWCRNQVQEAEFVLVVCTKIYQRRYEGKEDAGKGLGGQWEGFVITQELYDAAGRNKKFVPVVFSSDDSGFIPVELRATTRYDVGKSQGYDMLFRRITGQPERKARDVAPELRRMPIRKRKSLSSEPSAAGTSSAKLFAVDELNRIYRVSRDRMRTHLANKLIDFQPLIADRTASFVGRRFVFDAFEAFLSSASSGYFVILGEPGIGKTAVLAQLVRQRGFPHHFNVVQQNIRTARQFLMNACAQVIARYDLRYDFIPENAGEDSSLLLRYMAEAARAPENRPVTLVVDALDEVERSTLPPRTNILYLPPVLPEGVYLVAASRPLDNLRLQVSVRKDFFLESSSSSNMADIKKYIEDYVKDNHDLQTQLEKWGISRDDFTSTLALKSEGNFIYLRHILPEIGSGGFTQGNVADLPQGLKDYYRDHWEQMQIAEPDEFDKIYSPIVCMLAAAREPVTCSQLAAWARQDAAKVARALARWREFLDEVKGIEPKFRIYHTSFQDFLRNQVDLRRFDSQIAGYYLSLIDGTS